MLTRALIRQPPLTRPLRSTRPIRIQSPEQRPRVQTEEGSRIRAKTMTVTLVGGISRMSPQPDGAPANQHHQQENPLDGGIPTVGNAPARFPFPRQEPRRLRQARRYNSRSTASRENIDLSARIIRRQRCVRVRLPHCPAPQSSPWCGQTSQDGGRSMRKNSRLRWTSHRRTKGQKLHGTRGCTMQRRRLSIRSLRRHRLSRSLACASSPWPASAASWPTSLVGTCSCPSSPCSPSCSDCSAMSTAAA